tara:strand:- start:529 stop:660 length:132 start_codon:yes stop_codon:yes gene_type:complete
MIQDQIDKLELIKDRTKTPLFIATIEKKIEILKNRNKINKDGY